MELRRPAFAAQPEETPEKALKFPWKKDTTLSPSMSLSESRTAQSTYIIEVTKAEDPPVSGGPLPQPQIFQLSATSSASQPILTGSSAGEEWKSRLIFAESLLDGGVRFIFLVPPEEFKIEESRDQPSGEWRPLLDDEFKATRESNGNGQDRLTVILPEAEGKQRFLRLTPQG